jgi:hypothetical protein
MDARGDGLLQQNRQDAEASVHSAAYRSCRFSGKWFPIRDAGPSAATVGYAAFLASRKRIIHEGHEGHE